METLSKGPAQPFRIDIPDGELADLRARLVATRWPKGKDGVGWSAGMSQIWLRSIVDYWIDGFHWRRVEKHLNEAPQYCIGTRYGPVHFARLRAQVPNAIPIVLTHGWPSTFAELLPLARRLAAGSAPGHASGLGFDVIVPSLPGFIFSPVPEGDRYDTATIADQWAELMSHLGHERFLVHGGDIGASVSSALALRHPDRIAGVHLHYIPGGFQPSIGPSSPLTGEERDFLDFRSRWAQDEGAYSHLQATKPDTVATALNDSPAGLAAWIFEKYRSWSDCGGDIESRFSRDDLLTVATLYWFTGSMPTAIRLYWESRRKASYFLPGSRIECPVAFARFPKELPTPPRSYVERTYRIVRWTEFSSGGHFAGLEEPDALAADIRAFCTQANLCF